MPFSTACAMRTRAAAALPRWRLPPRDPRTRWCTTTSWWCAATNEHGIYRFRTIRPGALLGRLPHINFALFYSGLMRHLQTVMFFEKGADPVLAAASPRQELLVAKANGKNAYTFDLRLR